MDEAGKSQDELIAELRVLRQQLAQHEDAGHPSHEQMLQEGGLFREVVDRFVDAVILIDGATGQIDYANAAACRTIDCEVSDLAGANFSILLPSPDPLSVRSLLEEMKVHDGVFTQELLLADGTTCPMDMTATIMRWHSTDYVVLSLRDVTERILREQERERLLHELQEAMSRVQTLSGLLPICASCKAVRDDQGYWNQIEAYIRDHSEAEFSHGICPDCARTLYPDYVDDA